MTTPRAAWRDAYDAQMSLWSWLRTDQGADFLREGFLYTTSELKHAGTREMMQALWRSEMPKLQSADPIYVSADMCELIDAARSSFAPEPLLRTDLLIEAGFVFYARPFHVLDRWERPMAITGFSWAPMVTRKDSAEETEAVLEAWQQGNEGQGIAVTVYTNNEGPGRTPILPAHLSPWWFGMTFDGNEWDVTGKPTGAEWWWRLTQTTLRLMQQKIAAHHEERPERAARREAQRLRFPAQTVKVVRLRRESSEYTGPPSESANYSHRFIVGGHWRWQPYGDGIRRQIWIGDYVKGPEDKPLIIKPRRAFTWDR